MFLSQRATQAEYCDRPDLPVAEVADNYRQLARFNQNTMVSDVFQRVLVRWLGRANVKRLSILDLGAGDGYIGRTIAAWAKRYDWDWRVTNLDMNLAALRLGKGERRVVGSVCALPFAEDSFDVVIASQMTHHLTDEETVRHFREAWRVTRDALYLTDAHRNICALSAMWVLLRLMRMKPHFRSDGLLSVKRGWRVGEWRELAERAGIPRAKVSVYYGSRVLLQARKEQSPNKPRALRPQPEPILVS